VAPRLDSWHGVVARLQANKLSAIRLELETTRAGKPLRSAQGVSSPENKPLAQYSRHYVRPDVRPSEHKLFGANSRNWRKYIGAPEEIRTPDPQIRSVGVFLSQASTAVHMAPKITIFRRTDWTALYGI
jgi:hypothetical protein